MVKYFKFHELVSKVTIDPQSTSNVAKDILQWVKNDVKQIIPKVSTKKITAKKKRRV